MSEPLSPESLRHEALARLVDERASQALERARLTVAPSALRWEGSLGEVQGYEVTVGLPPARITTLREHPASIDALEEALARALAARPGCSLTALHLAEADEAFPAWNAYRRPGG